MEVKNCRGCGRLFNYVSGGYFLCAACMEELEQKFIKVKKYIRENPKATMQQISEENEVTTQQIQRWIREDRLAFSDDSPIGIDCEACGCTIKSGRFCNMCKDVMMKNLNSMYKRTEKKPTRQDPRDRARMRYLDNQ